MAEAHRPYKQTASLISQAGVLRSGAAPVGDESVDTHMAWEAERQALRPRYDAINAAEAAGELTKDEYTQQHGSIMDIEAELLDKIKTTPAHTIEGALLQIEVIDRYEVEIGGVRDRDSEHIKARTLALETIRQCLAAGARQAAVESDQAA